MYLNHIVVKFDVSLSLLSQEALFMFFVQRVPNFSCLFSAIIIIVIWNFNLYGAYDIMRNFSPHRFIFLGYFDF